MSPFRTDKTHLLERGKPRSSVRHRLSLERETLRSSIKYAPPVLLKTETLLERPNARSSVKQNFKSPLECRKPRSSGRAKFWAIKSLEKQTTNLFQTHNYNPITNNEGKTRETRHEPQFKQHKPEFGISQETGQTKIATTTPNNAR